LKINIKIRWYVMDKKYILDKLSQIDKNKYGIFEIGLFGS